MEFETGKFYWVRWEDQWEVVKYDGETGLFKSTDGSQFTPKSCEEINSKPIER
jgi:hypothetical protein